MKTIASIFVSISLIVPVYAGQGGPDAAAKEKLVAIGAWAIIDRVYGSCSDIQIDYGSNLMTKLLDEVSDADKDSVMSVMKQAAIDHQRELFQQDSSAYCAKALEDFGPGSKWKLLSKKQ